MEAARRFAAQEGVPINQLINVALAGKLSAISTETYLKERAARADVERARAILAKAGRGNPPMPGDELD